MYLVLEMAGHGDLLEYIKLRGAIPEEKSRHFFQQIGEAVDYLHTNNIVHRYGNENFFLSLFSSFISGIGGGASTLRHFHC